MNKKELEKLMQGKASKRYLDFILARDRRPSPDMAILLERATGIDRRAWIWPDEFPNPLLRPKDQASQSQAS